MEGSIVQYMREQRHDFMNHIQVIWGYLQLNKPGEAAKYITEVNTKLNVYGLVFKLESPTLSLFLYNHIKKAHRYGINVDFELEVDHIDSKLEIDFNNSLNDVGVIFNWVAEKTANSQEKILYIDIFEESGVLFMVFTNNSYDDYMGLMECSGGNMGTHAKNVIESLYEKNVQVYCKTDGDRITVKVGFKYKET